MVRIRPGRKAFIAECAEGTHGGRGEKRKPQRTLRFTKEGMTEPFLNGGK
jgi:hypothetical protein